MVSANSASVSPGKPTMMSVVMLMGRRAERIQCDFFEIFVARVGAQHLLENAVGARLHGQMNVVAEGRSGVDGFDDFASEVVGMRGGETHAANSGNRGDGQEQIDEIHAPGRGIAIGVHGLTEQLHFGVTANRRGGGLLPERRRWRGCAGGRGYAGQRSRSRRNRSLR